MSLKDTQKEAKLQLTIMETLHLVIDTLHTIANMSKMSREAILAHQVYKQINQKELFSPTFGDCFFILANEEYAAHGDASLLADELEMEVGNVHEISRSISLPSIWCVVVKDNGTGVEGYEFFDTEEEANARAEADEITTEEIAAKSAPEKKVE